MSQRRLAKLGRGSWIDGFMFYTSESECPESYLLAAAMHTISAAFMRQVDTLWGYYTFYPNLYAMLVGPPGITHKSTAIGFSKDFIKALGIPFSSEGISREMLIQQMKQRGSADTQNIAVTASEFATFMRTSGGAMVEFLNDIYDCPSDWEYATKSGGTQIVPRPYLTLLGGVVPEWMAREFNESFVEGGFASRTLFIRERVPRFLRAFPHISEEMLTVKLALVEDLAKISQIKGRYEWTPQAKAWFEQWYENEWFRHQKKELRGYESRMPSHVIRLAMILKAADSDELLLEKEDFLKAYGILSFLAPRMADSFSVVGRNPYMNDYERIMSEIETAGKVSYADLLNANSSELTKEQLDVVLENLRAMGRVSAFSEKGALWYRKGG